jgi:hypothetical protein
MARSPDQTFRLSLVAFRFVSHFLFLAVPFVAIIWYRSGQFIHAMPFLILALVFATISAVLTYLQLGKMMREIEAKKRADEAAL